MNRALLMSGGLGTRLRPLTNVIPKSLLPIGNETMLERQVRLLESHGFEEIYISICYLSGLFRALLDHLGSRCRSRLIIVEELVPTGPFGSVISLCRKLAAAEDSHPMLIINADVFTDVDFADVYRRFDAKHCMSVVVRNYKYQVPYGVVEIRNDELCAVEEKPTHLLPILAGIYCVRPRIHTFIAESAEPIGVDDVIETLLARGERIGIYTHDGNWIDTGTFEDLATANEFVRAQS
jgi:NDP-sugar pyrophosphorylase family protein